MNIPKTYLSLHDVTGLRITAGQSLERPLVLSIDGSHGSMEIVMFLQPLLTEAQIEAMAAAMTAAMQTAKPPPCPQEQAAYKAADDYWDRLKADLDRGIITPLKIVAADCDDAGVVHVRQENELGKLQAGAPSLVDGKR